MTKFGTFEIDTEKIIAVQWMYSSILGEEDGLMRGIRSEEPTSVWLYTDHQQFHLENEDFEAYRNANSI